MRSITTCGIAWLALLAVAGCKPGEGTGTTATGTSSNTTSSSGSTASSSEGKISSGTPSTSKEVTLPSGLKYEDIVIGSGAVAENGQTVIVHYTGWLTDKTKFESSRDRNEPYSFQLGAGNVIRGWDEGVKGMRVGGQRRLTIPPELGYGAQGSGGVIPPNATLVFDVELMGVR